MDNAAKYTPSDMDGQGRSPASPQTIDIDIDAAHRFLRALDPHSDKFTFQTFDDTPAKRKNLARVLHGTLDEHAPTLAALNAQGAGIFVTINETDLRGRENRNVVRVRAVFADFDGADPTVLNNCPLIPHINVESSPGRYHAYWLTSGLPLEQFANVQSGIANCCRSDPKVKDLPRVMRLPGFWHQKGQPFRSRLVGDVQNTSPYSPQQLTDTFLARSLQPIPGALTTAPPATTATVHVGPTSSQVILPRTITDLRSALCSLDADDRELWIAVAHDLWGLGNDGRTLWLEWSQQSDKYDARDAARTWRAIKNSGSDYRAVFTRAQKAGWVNPRSNAAMLPLNLGNGEGDARAPLPGFAPELLALPYGLGAVQQWVLNSMKYPSAATAGVTALALMTHCAMDHVTIASYDGLGLNEQYMILAPTGFGKEDTRKPFGIVARVTALQLPHGSLPRGPRIQHSAPASQQALHDLLQKQPAQTFLSDEFGDWIAQTERDPHKKAALVHFMQAYSRATTTLAAPHAVTHSYVPVEKPRVLVFATSTAERMMEVLTQSQAESGALNRFVMFAAEQDRIEKRYEGQVYEPSVEVISILNWVVALPETVVVFSPDAWTYFKLHDGEVIEPLKHKSYVLAGRLSEQAIKMAALIALSARRLVIERSDLETAYKIRENLYHRAAALIDESGAISGLHETAKAVEQVAGVIKRYGQIARARLPSLSRAYKKLDVRNRKAVVQTLLDDGVCVEVPRRKGVLQFVGT